MLKEEGPGAVDIILKSDWGALHSERLKQWGEQAQDVASYFEGLRWEGRVFGGAAWRSCSASHCYQDRMYLCFEQEVSSEPSASTPERSPWCAGWRQ